MGRLRRRKDDERRQPRGDGLGTTRIFEEASNPLVLERSRPRCSALPRGLDESTPFAQESATVGLTEIERCETWPDGPRSPVVSDAAAGLAVRRMHFHELMQCVHGEMHLKRTPPEIGAALGRESSDLFCLDEMQITDIADAVTRRLLDLTAADLGPAPAAWCRTRRKRALSARVSNGAGCPLRHTTPQCLPVLVRG